MVTMEGRQDYSSMSMRRALGSIIKKCQESSNDVILSSLRDLKQFCSLAKFGLPLIFVRNFNQVCSFFVLRYPMSAASYAPMLLWGTLVNAPLEQVC